MATPVRPPSSKINGSTSGVGAGSTTSISRHNGKIHIFFSYNGVS